MQMRTQTGNFTPLKTQPMITTCLALENLFPWQGKNCGPDNNFPTLTTYTLGDLQVPGHLCP